MLPVPRFYAFLTTAGLLATASAALAQTEPPPPKQSTTNVVASTSQVTEPNAAPTRDPGSTSALVNNSSKPTPQASSPLVSTPPKPEPTSVLDRLGFGKQGWVKLGGLAQGWFVLTQGEQLALDPETGATLDRVHYFRLRRALVSLKGSVIPDTVDFFVMANLAKGLKPSKPVSLTRTDGQPTTIRYFGADQDSAILLDFQLAYRTKLMDFVVGQWKSPISYEGGTSSSALLLPERAYSSLYFGDNYDIGLKAEKSLGPVKYSAQLLQGDKSNTSDSNKQKDIALRLEYRPKYVDGLFIGGAGLMSLGQRTTHSTTRDIVEVDAGYERDGLLVRGEALWGWYGRTEHGARTRARGANVSAAYLVQERLQPVVRLSSISVSPAVTGQLPLPLEAKLGLMSDDATTYEAGVNWLFDGTNSAKLMLSYAYTNLAEIANVATADGSDRHQVIAAAQVAF